MSAARPRRAAAGAAAVCALLALAACTSSSADDSGDAAAAHAEGPKAGKDARTADGAASDDGTLGTLTLTATKNAAVLHPLVPLAPRTFAPAVAAAGDVHSVRIRQTRWNGPLRQETVSGALDWSGKGRVELTFRLTAGSAGDGTDDQAGPNLLRACVIGDTGYVREGDKPEKGAGGRHWVKVGQDDMTGLQGVNAASMNPLKQVTAVLALPTLVKVGTGTFRGLPATHYRSTLSAATLDEAVAAGAASARYAEGLKSALENASVTSETLEMWMTQDRLPLEVTVEDEYTVGSNKQVTDYLDYGAPVGIEAPPVFDTITSGELDKLQGADDE